MDNKELSIIYYTLAKITANQANIMKRLLMINRKEWCEMLDDASLLNALYEDYREGSE